MDAINTLPLEAEPPIVTTIEPTEPPVATPPEPVTTEPEVDVTPDPETLKAEVEELRKQREKAEQDAAYWRRQKAESRADFFRGREQGGVPPAPPATPPEGIDEPPKESDFEDYTAFVNASTDYKVKVARAEWDRDAKVKENQGKAVERQQVLEDKLADGYVKYPDFEEVARNPNATYITPLIKEIITDSDHAADVAYYLGNNPVEGVKISRMTPIQAVKAIANIERDLAAKPPTVNLKPTVPGAPPPIKPVGSAEKVTKDPKDMNQKEYNAWRESQGARRF